MLRHTPSITSGLRTSKRFVLPLASLLVWTAVAFSAVTWGLRWSAAGVSPSQSPPTAPALPALDTAAVARSLGAAPVQAAAAPTLDSRFQLQGVMAGTTSQGAALIAVDGQVAKPFRVGATVAEGLVLQSVQGRRVSLGATQEGAPSLVLELPAKK